MAFPHLSYVVTEFFCLIYVVSILLRLNRSVGSEHEVLELRNMIYAFFVMLTTDIFCELFDDDVLYPGRWVIISFNAVLVISISLGCYFWFRYIQDRLHQTTPHQKLLDTLFQIPIVLICSLDIISVFTGWLFYLDEDMAYQSTDMFVLQSIVNYFYLVVPALLSARRAIRTRVKQEREEFLTYAIYMIIPLIAGLLEEYLPLVPMLALSIFMIIHMQFLTIQNLQIYHDALTGLNNRRRLNQYLALCLSGASAEHPVVLLMMDINGFKSVNDTFGHIEGDNALCTFARILKRAAEQYHAFIARYGGDEFCLVAEAPGSAPEEIAEKIQALLRDAQHDGTAGNVRYTLTVSVGFSVCDTPECDPEFVLGQADKMLYANKKAWHLANG